MDNIINITEQKMKKSIESFEMELIKIRTGRANPNMLNHIHVDYYGTPTPINQVATISVPEPRQLIVKPYERNLIKAISASIVASDLGLQPQDQGDFIRLNIPQLTEERRKSLVKEMYKLAEHFKIAVRNNRREANDEIKATDLTDDQKKHSENDVQKLTDKYAKLIDELATKKEKELMTI